MKKILSLLGAITLIGTSTTNLVACNTPQEYTPEELTKLKTENKINTTNQEIKDNLEWIAPQEKPFNEIDNKYYFVVWRGNKNDDWRIVKFKNFEKLKDKVLDKYDNYKFKAIHFGWNTSDLFIYKNGFVSYNWKSGKGTYFKSVYRWNSDSQEPNLIVNKDGVIQVS